ncbi:type II toxin-antitoxin system RelE/ParE family toxin [Herbidospora cretacea]|uniref:type II toxin-antitoxin system RelE/ParE family toxin n=1 Tax=Herbidospora cretacea TaxID=28444 RepID=UPI001FE19ACF|nr:type II toxin-antitoxin system RelE/ParE family toxin [Herbidospora cretacea]
MSWSLRFASGSKSCRWPHSRKRPSIDLLAAEGPLLGEPYTRQLDGKLRELRFHLDDLSMRVSYWIAPHRRIVLLTVFHKTRMREDREVDRARRALLRCVDQAPTVDVDEEPA